MSDFIKNVEDDIIKKAMEHDQKVIEKETERIEKHEEELKDHEKGLIHDYLEARVVAEEDRKEVKEERIAEDIKNLEK